METVRIYETDDPMEEEYSKEASQAVAELLEYMKEPPSVSAYCEALRFCGKVLEICAKYRLHPTAFSQRCRSIVSHHEFEQAHLAGCEDLECDMRICMEARGLTDEEKEVVLEKSRREIKAFHERRARAMNGRR